MSDEPLKAGSVVKVEFEIALPCDATYHEVERWVGLELGRGSASGPLTHYDLESIRSPDVIVTGRVLREERTPQDDGSTLVRRWTEYPK